MQDVLVCGARSFSYDVADVIGDTPGFKLVGFVENEDRERCPGEHIGLPLHWVEDIEGLAAHTQFVCALATTHRNRFTEQMEGMGFAPATVVHPTAHVSGRSALGPGCIALPRVVVAAETEIGRHVLLSRGVLVGHHTRVGDHVSVQPGANVAGSCMIGAGTYVGMGSIVLNGLSVGAHAVVGAGAVVTRDVPDRTQVVGVPAKAVKEGIGGL